MRSTRATGPASSGSSRSASASTTNGSSSTSSGSAPSRPTRATTAWQQAKLLYVGRLIDHKRPELAETFFNSVTTRVLHHTYLHDDLMFMRAAVSTEYIPSEPPSYRSYYPHERGLRATFLEIFRDAGWSRPFADLERDVDHVMQAIAEPARPEPELPGAGSRLGALPQQGRVRRREDRQRPRGDAVRRSRAARRRRAA